VAAHVLQISHHFGRLVIWQFGQNGTLQIASSAPGAKNDDKAKALSRTKQNGHFRRQSSIDFGAGMVHLKPEWSI
jgi:hypothetical protein